MSGLRSSGHALSAEASLCSLGTYSIFVPLPHQEPLLAAHIALDLTHAPALTTPGQATQGAA